MLLLGVVFVLLLSGCSDSTLPTIGRTKGNFAMQTLLKEQQDCFQVERPIYFEAPFATGMSFSPPDCLDKQRKIGRKSVAEVAQLRVTITYDGDYYIIKHGH
ncbi:hypothetical protein [Alteromonas oceanisediminis]|uniref:hypothetical protein n=1 Tax=Alteromonas oceanisediminis TaxID=2836180 RepID=UPI001BD9B222|nr:hypothetical protein [Alteromonas oceanisediminis]MBT0587233.1 hypothetical protein [Alteromonas oceanisediminis]